MKPKKPNKAEIEKELVNIKKSIDQWKKKKQKAVKFGKQVIQNIYKQFPGSEYPKEFYPKGREPDKFDSLACMHILAEIIKGLIDRDDGENMPLEFFCIENAFEYVYGAQVEKAIPMMEELHQLLVDNKYDKDNHFEFNDLDNYCWYEKAKDKKVIGVESQNITVLFIIEPEIKITQNLFFRKIGCRKVHQNKNQKKYYYYKSNHINFYRKNNFDLKVFLSYRFEDKVFGYHKELDTGVAKHVWHNMSEVNHILWNLDSSLQAIKEHLEFKKKEKK